MTNPSELVKIGGPCSVCGTRILVTVTTKQLTDWQNGELIQRVMPELSSGEREFLMSGTCDSCFNEMFKECEDEDEE